MKKLAARDFEDILQVSTCRCFYPSAVFLRQNISPSSVGSQSWRASCQVSTTRSCSISPSTWQRGMHMQNFGCTLPTRSTRFGCRRRSSAVNSAVMPTKCIPNTKQNRYQERLPPTITRKPEGPRRPPLHLNNPTQNPNLARAQTPNHLTSRHTSSIRLVTMQTTLNSLAQQTASQHNRFVPLSLGPPMAEKYSPIKQGELEHQQVKKFYKCTNKLHFEQQIAKHE